MDGHHEAPQAHWQVLPDATGLARRAAAFIADEARRAIAHHGAFNIVLAGGTTPLAAYQRLREHKLEWRKWQVYFGDERVLPHGHADRNDRAITEALLAHVALLPTQIHAIPVELGATAAAAAYAVTIDAAMPFDLVVLGIGEDGHTASLFPEHPESPTPSVIAVADAPKPPSLRVSLNYCALRNTHRLLVLAQGAGKRTALRQWQLAADLPIARVTMGLVSTVLVDKAAWVAD